MMKRNLFLLSILLFSIKVFAQDPDVGGTTINGTIGDGSAPHANGETISFTIDGGNAGPDMTLPPPSNAPFEINITVGHFANPVVSVAPGFTNYFSTPVITLVNASIPSYTITITQNQVIPEGEYTRFIITGTASGSDGDLIQYQANGDPGGYPNVGTDDPSSSAGILGVLPVTLVSFNAAKEGTSTNLKWATTAETNSDFFEVQHSLNAKNWSVLGSVKSHGESAVLRNYSYPHATPSNGTNYYRLRMVDKDQTYAYSTIRSTTFEGLTESTVSLFPNPASDLLFVNNAEINKLKTLTIVGQDGKELITSPVSVSGVSLKSLQPGLYLVKLLSSDGALSTHKLVISK